MWNVGLVPTSGGFQQVRPNAVTHSKEDRLTTPALWHEAVDFAARQHSGQVRKDRVTPYIGHPFRVALTVAHTFGLDDECAIAAALLHDTLEDTRTDYEDLARAFGPWVADAVATLSDNKALPESRRQSEYHDRLAQADWRIVVVKLADCYDNLIDSAPPAGMPSLHAGTRRKARQLLELVRPRAGESEVLGRAIEVLDRVLEASAGHRLAGPPGRSAPPGEAGKGVAT